MLNSVSQYIQHQVCAWVAWLLSCHSYVHNFGFGQNTTNLQLHVLQQEEVQPPARNSSLQCLRRPNKANRNQFMTVKLDQRATATARRALPLNWVHKVKKKSHGFLKVQRNTDGARMRVRLFGFDNTKPYSPVAKFTSIRLPFSHCSSTWGVYSPDGCRYGSLVCPYR